MDLLQDNIKDLEESLYYLCGLKKFVHKIVEMLETIRVKKEQIKIEIL